MIVTITLEANNEEQLIERLNQIQNSISLNTIQDHELMDGTYQVDNANIEMLELESV